MNRRSFFAAIAVSPLIAVSGTGNAKPRHDRPQSVEIHVSKQHVHGFCLGQKYMGGIVDLIDIGGSGGRVRIDYSGKWE